MPRTIIAVCSAVIGMLPVALSGALILFLRDDLALSLRHFGLLVACFFVANAISAQSFGSIIDRMGAFKGFKAAALLSAVSLAGIGASSSSLALGAALAVGGLANGIANPAANRFISMVISPGRQGLAFGAKQASIPLAGTLAGGCVVVVNAGLPWRLVFAIFAAAAVLIFAASHWLGPSPAVGRAVAGTLDVERSKSPRLRMPLVALGAALGSAAAAPLGIFLVESAVAIGLAAADAGWLLASVSLCGVMTRVVLGWSTDRYPPRNPFVLVGAMLITSVIGFVGLAAGWLPLFVAGTFIAYISGWSWNGIFQHGVVSHSIGSPGRASGTIQAALSSGGAAGPLLFGSMASLTSYAGGWLSMGALAVMSGTALLFARK